ncbi:MAG: membrane protein insertase YidC [Herpetosiphonaceae bacterium]|nr:membrane protein insertase YidC [Herpetosiphonaceae bacterium]
MFDSIGKVLLPILNWLFNQTGSLGIAIIVFTIFIRIAMLPLTVKQLKSQKKMMILQPKLREIQRKYGKDREKVTEETLKLYKAHGTNPASGCLPLLISLPILFGVWSAIQLFNTTGVAQEALRFLWIPSLTDNLALGLKGRDPYFILPVISIILQFITQQMAMPRNPDPQQAQMNRIMVFMPLMFGWFAFTIPAGAVLYMVTGSVIQMIQQYFTTGFGSLPKYLPFLPERSGFLTQPAVSPEADGGETVEESPRHDFWTALNKLAAPLSAEAGSRVSDDAATEAALDDVRTQMRRPVGKRQRRRGPKPDSSIGG